MPHSNGKALRWDHGLRRKAIVESLLADVFEGRLGAGQHLVTQDLAERFRVSHTPIREALVALAGVGIIGFLPNPGGNVCGVMNKDLREIAPVRRWRETSATHAAVVR